ncbi:hypothetical protein ABIB83_005453 [Bradyrhizobium sp. I1.8.5]
MTDKLTVVVEQGERGPWHATSPEGKGPLAVQDARHGGEAGERGLLDLERARRVMP